ncbi:hypothetical protein L6452_42609 [Arctium lappa]|uniref:Uncharacterized protein n=1 Tax=Arctium lappa TaxID=4217 RepID=A0ACB8XJE6_ARCLA|nr:hypothetical protein L6452_42609 [Arctium lappa]
MSRFLPSSLLPSTKVSISIEPSRRAPVYTGKPPFRRPASLLPSTKLDICLCVHRPEVCHFSGQKIYPGWGI